MAFVVTWKKENKTSQGQYLIERFRNLFSFIKIQQWKAIERHGPKEEKNLWDEFLSHIGYSMGKKRKTVQCCSIAILLQTDEEKKVFSKWRKDYSRQERTKELCSCGIFIKTFTNQIKILTCKSCKFSKIQVRKWISRCDLRKEKKRKNPLILEISLGRSTEMSTESP